MSEDEGKMQAKTASGVTLTLEYYLPDDLIPHLSDGLIVTRTEDLFVLSFLQSEPPLVTSDQELIAKGKVRSKCVARLFITPQKFEAFVGVLSKQLPKK
jgi:hypothetical protein